MVATDIPWRTLYRRFDDGFWEQCVATPLPDGMSDVDKVDWDNVKSCYTAQLIPLMVRGLCADNQLVRDKALACLDDEIHHQGSTFESSKLVVGFLVRLLESDAPIDKPWVLDLIERPGLWGLAPASWRKNAKGSGLQLGREWHKQLGVKKWEWGNPTSTCSASGKPRFRFLCWHENGALRLDGSYVAATGKHWIEGSHAQGFKDGSWKQSSSSGKRLGEYEMAEGTGTEVTWHENGEMRSRRELISGLQHGRSASWHENGQLEEESTFEKGKRTGTWRRWRTDGTLERQGEYRNNVEHGRFVNYDADGRVEEERDYQRGKRHGIANSYTGGVQVIAGQFRLGKRDGTWKHWDEAGRMVKTVLWRKNKMVGVEKALPAD